MTYVNEYGYLERRTNSKKNPAAKGTTRNWWIVKAIVPYGAYVSLTSSPKIRFPAACFGKKVRFKVEIIGDVNDKRNPK